MAETNTTNQKKYLDLVGLNQFLSKLKENFVLAQDTDETLEDVDTLTYIKYVSQILTNDQKLQVATNIGNDTMTPGHLVKYDENGTVVSNGITDGNILYAFPNSSLAESENVDIVLQDRLISGTNIKTVNGESILGTGDLKTAGYISTTYSELKELRDNAELIPGTWYRITDYVTTTVQENTQSAGHQFDVLVLATSENTLSEEARAVLHDGDTYFSENGANLNAWKLWYCLDNDTVRFAWADSTNGKGVIYRMIDEWNNDCPYDFKNILYAIYQITDAQEDYLQFLVGMYQALNTPINNLNYTLNTTPLYAYTFCYTDDNVNVIDATVIQYSNVSYPKIKNNNNVIRKRDQGLHVYNENILLYNIFISNSASFFISNEVVGYYNTFITRSVANTIYGTSGSIFSGNGNVCEMNNSMNNSNIIVGANNIIDRVSNCILTSSNCRYELVNSVKLGNEFKFSSLKNVSGIYIYSEDPDANIINYDIHSIEDLGQNIVIPTGGEYLTKVTMNSSGDIKIYCEADLIA